MVAADAPIEPIDPDLVYPISGIRRYTGWGGSAVRTARRKGLKVKYCGRRGFVRGSALIEHIDKHGKDKY